MRETAMSKHGNNGTGFWLIIGLIVVMSLVAIAEAGATLVLVTARKLIEMLPIGRVRASVRGS
jgi:hypothetical protein